MLWTILLLLVLLVFWGLGMGPLSLGPLIHLVLVIALIIFAFEVVTGRRVE